MIICIYISCSIRTRTTDSPCPWEHDTFYFFFIFPFRVRLNYNLIGPQTTRIPICVLCVYIRRQVHGVILLIRQLWGRDGVSPEHCAAVSVAFARHTRAVYNISVSGHGRMTKNVKRSKIHVKCPTTIGYNLSVLSMFPQFKRYLSMNTRVCMYLSLPVE